MITNIYNLSHKTWYKFNKINEVYKWRNSTRSNEVYKWRNSTKSM